MGKTNYIAHRRLTISDAIKCESGTVLLLVQTNQVLMRTDLDTKGLFFINLETGILCPGNSDSLYEVLKEVTITNV